MFPILHFCIIIIKSYLVVCICSFNKTTARDKLQKKYISNEVCVNNKGASHFSLVEFLLCYMKSNVINQFDDVLDLGNG